MTNEKHEPEPEVAPAVESGLELNLDEIQGNLSSRVVRYIPLRDGNDLASIQAHNKEIREIFMLGLLTVKSQFASGKFNCFEGAWEVWGCTEEQKKEWRILLQQLQ